MRRRKNFIPIIFLTLLAWLGLGYLIYTESPNNALSIPIPVDPKILFFFLLFLALFFSFSLLFQNTRRGVLVATGLTVVGLLRFFHLLHPLYIVFVIALVISIELFFLKK